MQHFAEVAIPAGVDKTFTYLIPDSLLPTAHIGVRVLVPFGKKTTTGLIVGLPGSSTHPHLKNIADVLDREPVLSSHLLALCTWIAQYYVAPLGDVIRAAMPHGFGQSSRRKVRVLVQPDDPRIAALRKRSAKRAQILDVLFEHGTRSATDLQKMSGLKSIHSALNEMEADGLLATEEVLPRPRATVKTREFLDIGSVDSASIRAAIDQLPARKKKAANFLTSVLERKDQGTGETDLLEFLKCTQTSTAILKPFRESGLLPVVRREVTRQQDYGLEEQTLRIVLNTAQQSVRDRLVAALDEGRHRTFLLHGVTGSGKTQVYIEAIRHCLDVGKTAIVLVPEISLTPQIVRRFKSHFGDSVLVVHSRMSAGERYDVWRLALAGRCRVVIGPRSAVFAPLHTLGLIVVDEEHEASYKQYDSVPRYHARDVAIMRGHDAGAVVMLGSATPSLESFANARSGKFELLTLPDRIDQAVLPDVHLVDMTSERKDVYTATRASLPEDQRGKMKDFRHPSLSRLLQDKIADRLERREGIILLQNRRGFAPFVECRECGYVEMCDNCHVSMTYHLSKKHLRCHYCGLVRRPALLCPQCGGSDIRLHGVGTQRVEEELAATFPSARVLRMDLDTTSRRGAHDRILRQFGERTADILLGTQMVAKGLDFPHVTLVGVISADTQMLLPDFRSSERTFQLLTQVAGRAGRSTLKGEVIIQTSQPDHRTLVHVLDHDYDAYFREEIAEREELNYPPLSRLVLVETRGEDEEEVRKLAERLGTQLKHDTSPYAVLGPAPAVIGRINRQYRWHIVLKISKSIDPSGSLTHACIRQAIDTVQGRIKKTQVIVDVDPVGIM
ncbi:MAG TPA: primosomal protein N' [Bacteroidota bacterium]|nr:primosomal protein N' [Bacteroidota bacterium]